jgi:hypothetical protein
MASTETASESFYPPEQGGHPRGWGLGPCYRIKETQKPGRPGGCEPQKPVPSKKFWKKG